MRFPGGRHEATPPVATLIERRNEVERLADDEAHALAEARSAAGVELAKLAAAEILGEISAESADSRRGELQDDLARRQAEVERLRLAMPELGSRIDAEARKERDVARRRAERHLSDAISARSSAEKALSRGLQEAATAAAELRRHRGLVETALAEVHALDPERGYPKGFDETWEPLSALKDLLNAGPEQTVAEHEARLERSRKQVAQQESEVVGWFRRDPRQSKLAQIPDRLRPKCEAILAEAIAADERALAARQPATAVPDPR